MTKEILVTKRVHKTSKDVSLSVPSRFRKLFSEDIDYFKCEMKDNTLIYSPIVPKVVG